MGKNHRVFREGFPHHTYTRGLDGNVLFYSQADCVYYLTLYFCLARRYGITVLAFCIWPNNQTISIGSPRYLGCLLNQMSRYILTRARCSRQKRLMRKKRLWTSRAL